MPEEVAPDVAAHRLGGVHHRDDAKDQRQEKDGDALDGSKFVQNFVSIFGILLEFCYILKQ